MSGAGVTPAADSTWDSGLFVSLSDQPLSIRNLTFADSFNNGIAWFVPAHATGTMKLLLQDVKVLDATFHGVFFDDQITTGFNTDDEPQDACTDPYPFESGASLQITLRKVEVVNAGVLPEGFDTSIETGCPQDFDGVRVDEGALGKVVGRVSRSRFDSNLADGLEFDEKGDGGIDLWVWGSSFDGNGDTEPVFDALGNSFTDLDDGLDLDEADAGSIVARIIGTSIDDNFDEGLDLDEAGEGGMDVALYWVTGDRNEDQGFKLSEENAGSVRFRAIGSSASDSLSQDGIELEEEEEGDLDALVFASTVTGNDDAGIKVSQELPGSGALTVKNSDLSGNNDGATDTDPTEVTETLIDVIE